MSTISFVMQNLDVIRNNHHFIEPDEIEETPALCKTDCPTCHGLRFVRSDAKMGETDFGKIFPCPQSDPFKRYNKLLGLIGDEQKLSWTSIAEDASVMKGVNAVRNAIERGYGWVFLWGSYGLAKTLILKVAVAEYVRATRNPASYLRMAEIIDHLRGAFDAQDPSSESARRLDIWSDLPLLCIDEFDRIRNTEYAVERRFVLMDRRYEQACRQNSVTLMASNTDPDSMEGYLTDRIHDGRFAIVHLTGKSVRRS
jgi:DNA replication protein DnaC